LEPQQESKNLWEDVVNEQGRHSLTENIVPRVVTEYCKPDDHYWEEFEDSRTAVCKKCGILTRYILGKDILIDGKFQSIH
jgi:hypothetical protein